MDLGPGQERLDVGSGRPGGSRERPAYPGKVGLGEACAGQVRTGEVVQSAVGERLRQSIRRGDAKAGGQALHADPVHGPGALSRLAESAADSAAGTADLAGWRALAEASVQGVDAAEGGADAEDDRDRQSHAQAAGLRAAYSTMGPHSRAGELVRALQKASPEFAGLWERHEVAKRFADHKILIHPLLGPIEVDCQALFTEDQSQALLVLTAPPHTESYEKLRLLAVLGQEHFAEAGRGG